MARFKLVPESHLLLIRDDRILLLRRRNTDYEDGKYSAIAGHMEDGETAREAICREAHEEAGIELAPADLEFAHVVHRARRLLLQGAALARRAAQHGAAQGRRFPLVCAGCPAGRYGALRPPGDRVLAGGSVLQRIRLEPLSRGGQG
jgi:ADP-ribose pyrophosphatase YjhB (NUDIX family)